MDELLRDVDLVVTWAASAWARTTWSRRRSPTSSARSSSGRSRCSPASRRASGYRLASGTPIVTLPGNPVSAYVSFEMFVRAALGALQGQRDWRPPSVRATVAGPLDSPRGRVPICADVLNRADNTIVPLSGQGSHQVAALGRVNALIVVPEWVTDTKEGDEAEVLCRP